MTCPRATDTDFAAFAADRDAAEWRDLRAHYPACPDCSREVAVWSRMDEALRGAAEESHLGDADLMAFAETPASLTSARRAQIETHLAACAPCRTEMAVLRRFDFAALRAPSAESIAAAQPSLGARIVDWLPGWLQPLGAPGWAMAVLLLLAIPVGIAVWRGFGAAPTPPPIAHEEPTPEPPRAPDPGVEEAPRELAHDRPDAPDRAVPGIASEPEAPPPMPTPAVIAESPVRETAPPDGPAPDPDASQTVAGRSPDASSVVADRSPDASLPSVPSPPPVEDVPIDIDRLLGEAPPDYRPRLALAGGSLASTRRSTAIRGAEDALPEATPLLPEHVAATQTATPTLYWRLADRAEVPVEITLIAEDGIEPLVENRIPAPVAGGLHAVALEELGVALEPGVTYQLHVALVPDDARRDLDVIATAAVRYTPATPALSRSLAEAGPGERPKRLAEAGYWIDAFDAVSRIAVAHPGSERAAAWRASLLEQVGHSAFENR